MKKIMSLILALCLICSLSVFSFADEESKASIEKAVLLEESGVKITAKSLSHDGLFGPELKLLIENNSGISLTFQCRNASVNGCMVDTMMSAEVADGKKANEELIFMKSYLKNAGIVTIGEMEFSFHIFTTDGWDTFLDTPSIKLETSAVQPEYPHDDSGIVIYDNGGVRIISKGLAEEPSILGPGITVLVENNSDRQICVQTRDCSVNGFMVDAMFSCEVAAGKYAINSIDFLNSTLEENEIEAIEDVEFYLHIFDGNSWNTIDDSDTIFLEF